MVFVHQMYYLLDNQSMIFVIYCMIYFLVSLVPFSINNIVTGVLYFELREKEEQIILKEDVDDLLNKEIAS